MLAMFKMTALLVGAMAWSGGAAARVDEKEGVKLLDGTWQVVSQTTEGKEEAIPKDGGDMLVVSNGKYTLKQGDRELCTGTYTLDPTTSPKAVDNVMADGPAKGKTARGIYQLTGDELKISWSSPGEAERPAGFEAKSYRVTTLKRLKG